MKEKIRKLRLSIFKRRRADPVRRVHVIVNPASGRNQPVLKILNSELHKAKQKAKFEWEMLVTKKAGDAFLLAKKAVKTNADLVAVYGGDGTVMETASGLLGSTIPMAILPGGTGNLLATELGIPHDLLQACSIAMHPEPVYREVDIGQVGEHNFLVRVGMGLEEQMIEGAKRETKDRLGSFAYALSALQALVDPPVAHYHLTIDGNEVESEGITCIITNVGAIGGTGFSMAPNIDVSDGLLDVLVLRQVDLISILSMLTSVVRGNENQDALQHWQGREITIGSDPVQKIQIDGEILGQTPVTARVVPRAIRIIVPAPPQGQLSGETGGLGPNPG